MARDVLFIHSPSAYFVPDMAVGAGNQPRKKDTSLLSWNLQSSEGTRWAVNKNKQIPCGHVLVKLKDGMESKRGTLTSMDRTGLIKHGGYVGT